MTAEPVSPAARSDASAASAGPYVLDRFRLLLDKIEHHQQGALLGEDIHHLHQLRTSTRRTRSALAGVKGVLPLDAVKRFKADFRWLQRSTGRKRDLDVLRATWARVARSLPPEPSAAAASFEAALGRRAGRLQAEVAEALLSDRYRALVAAWRALLTSDATPDAADAPMFRAPLDEVARASVRRAWRRLRKQGAGVDETTPVAQVHEVRIAAKRLRYVLAFFAEPLEHPEVQDEIAALKRMQDVLGDLNDVAHQRLVIGPGLGAAAELAADDPAQEVLRGVAERLAERYAKLRRKAPERIAAFVTKERDAHFRELFGA